MKKLLVLFALAGLLLTTPLKADNTVHPDWIWINGLWVYVGSGDPEEPPPPPPLK